MRLSIIIVAVTVLSTLCILGQTVDRVVSILDHRFLSPASQVLHQGRVYTSYYDRPGVRVFDSTLSSSREIDDLRETLAGELFRVGGQLLVKSIDGNLYGLDESTGQWPLVGNYECISHQYDSDLFVLSGSEVFSLEFNAGSWQSRRIGRVASSTRPVAAFVVVGDTIVYAHANSIDIIVATLSGSFVRSVASHSPVDRLQLFGDGLIAISAIQRTSQVLRSGSLLQGQIEYLYHQNSLVSLTHAAPFNSANGRGLIGTFSTYGSDPREGVYVIRSLDSIVRRRDLDSICPVTIRATMHEDRFVLSEYGRIAIVDAGGAVTEVDWFVDSTFAFSGMSFTKDGVPLFCGQAKFRNNAYPAIFPTSEQDSVRVVEVEEASKQLLIRVLQLENGPEVSFCSFGIFTRQNNEDWKSAYPVRSGISRGTIDIVNDSIIVCRSIARRLLLSTNKGVSWREIAIDGYFWQMTPVLASGESMFIYEPGTLWKVDLTDLADSISPPRVNISIGVQQRLFACSGEVVEMVTARSDTDPSFNPEFYTYLICHRWNTTTMQLDSVRHDLANPLTSAGLNYIVRNDTAYIWDYLQRRLLAVTYDGIVYDTSFTGSTFGVLRNEFFSTVATDNEGNPWLFTSGQTMGFKLDPSKSVVSSVQEYYGPLYVSSVRPNPAADNVNVTVGRFPAADDSNMKLYLVDMQGRTVRDYTHMLTRFPSPTSTQDVSINVDDLPSGMYLVVIENRQGKSVKKLMVSP